jgi:cell pole-organizing protein PopZ
MSDQTSQEPTMEEILASIRRIISEDDAPASGDAKPGDPPQPAVSAEQTPAPEQPHVKVAPVAVEEPHAAVEAPEEEDEVLELTDRVESHGDLDVYVAPPAPPEAAAVEPEPEPARPELPPAPVGVEPKAPASDTLVAAATATAAASAFGQLSAAIAMPRGERTLEDVVRELLRPMLKDWLDQNLAGIVQSAVSEEVERIARSRMR